MKLMYQQMLAFFVIIMTSAAIIGYSVLNFATQQAYSSNFERLQGYAESMGKIALSKNKVTGRYNTISADFLDELQVVMHNDDVTLKVFDGNNNQVYPIDESEARLPNKFWTMMEDGKIVHIQNDHEEERRMRISNKEAYSWVLVPWIDDDKLVGAVWLGAKVTNVEEPVTMAKNNLITALLVTMIVGLILSYFLAYFTINRIKRLSRATKRVASGDFDVQIPHKDNDEIDELATDFNSMVQSLRDSNDEIARQEDRRNQFLADAAHEMRTPLTTLNGILEGLQYDAIPEESKGKSIELMRNETNRLIRLVNENLDYEKIRNNQILLFKTKFDSVSALEDIMTQLQQKAEESNDKLELIGDKEVEVYADHDRFTQIMFNLLQNALQFTQAGKVTISAKRIDHGAEFKVSDTGIGMDQEQVRFIFDRFYKADPSRKKSGIGESGLGLAIVASLIRQHGGLVEVDSQPQIGTTFTVTLFDDGYQHYQEVAEAE